MIYETFAVARNPVSVRYIRCIVVLLAMRAFAKLQYIIVFSIHIFIYEVAINAEIMVF